MNDFMRHEIFCRGCIGDYNANDINGDHGYDH